MRFLSEKNLLLSCFLTAACLAQSQTSAVPIFAFGPAGLGGDDTSAFQNGLNWTASQGQTLEIPAGTYNVGPLTLPSNTALLLDPNVVVQATPGFGLNDRLITIVDAQNISVTGTPGQSSFRMQKSEYTSGEFRHCIGIYGATNVQLSGIQCNNSGGDGIYIGEGTQGFSANIRVLNSGFDNNRRQGMSVVSGQSVLINNCSFTNTRGTGPSAGLDIEPNGPTDVLQGIQVINSFSSGNDGNGVNFAMGRMNSSSVPISVTVSGFLSQGNHGSGFFASNEQDGSSFSVRGVVAVNNSTSNGDAAYGAIASYWETGGTALVFRNLTVLNANSSRTNVDNAAITVKRGGGASHRMGNVHFYRTSVVDTAGYLGVYFTVYDWSNIGISELQFLAPVQLTGAAAGVGLFNGIPALIVNVD